MLNGLVLAGGKSIRMGNNKALLEYYNIPQYVYAANLLQQHCTNVYISSNVPLANTDYMQFADDDSFANAGPLSGLLTAFNYYKSAFLVLAIDYPLIDNKYLTTIATLSKQQCKTVVAYNSSTNYFEPWIACYTVDFLQQLTTAFFNNNTLALQQYLQLQHVIKSTPSNLQVLQSIDTPEQMQKILNNEK
jgi:molybdopterin-guanine dinucleotide biosynthesis protein A